MSKKLAQGPNSKTLTEKKKKIISNGYDMPCKWISIFTKCFIIETNRQQCNYPF